MSGYSPFTGYGSNQPQQSSGGPYSSHGLGSKLQTIDWQSQQLTKSNWVVFSPTQNMQGGRSQAVSTDSTLQKALSQRSLSTGVKQLKSEKVETDVEGPLDDEESVLEWRKKHAITIFGVDAPTPMVTFDELEGVAPAIIIKNLKAQGFAAPTAIQAQAWPVLFQNRDFIGIAKTGSGKTMAFIVPALAHIAVQEPLKPGEGCIALVLAPTRELAQQIEVETRKVLPQTLRCCCIFGGTPKGIQLRQLGSGAHIIIATPGRLIDFLEMGRTSLLRVTYLVLDEADRMLDMGFEPQVQAICSQIRVDRQTQMFSATWPKEIQSLAGKFMRDPLRIHIGSTELSANKDVTQKFLFVSEDQKMMELKKILATSRETRTLVFTKMKKQVDFLEKALRVQGCNVLGMHGDKEQSQRDYVLNRFRKENGIVLIATDVAARGLDVKNLDVVINYDFPMSLDDYVHRIGRTGRAGATGFSYSFITKTETQLGPQVAGQLVGLLEKSGQAVPQELIDWSREFRGGFRGSRFGNKKAMPSFNYNQGDRPTYMSNNPTSNTAPYSQQGFGGASAMGRPQFPNALASPMRQNAPSSAPQSVFGVEPGKSSRIIFEDDDDDSGASKRARKE